MIVDLGDVVAFVELLLCVEVFRDEDVSIVNTSQLAGCLGCHLSDSGGIGGGQLDGADCRGSE